MTARKPPTTSFPDWIEGQIRRAEQSGAFDDLPGAGKPIPGIDRPQHELAWVAGYLRRENVDTAELLPPALAIAKEVENLRDRLAGVAGEPDAREIVGDLNRRIDEAHARPQVGPVFRVKRVPVDATIEQWRVDRAALEEVRRFEREQAAAGAPPPARPSPLAPCPLNHPDTIAAMGLLTPLAVKIGSLEAAPKFLPQIVWVDEHMQKWTRGRLTLLDVAGLPNLMLTVPGRKSGVPRSTPLLCVPYGDKYLIAGSYFGGPKEPIWVANLEASLAGQFRFDGVTRAFTARAVTGEERTRVWQHMLKTWPNFAKYEQRTSRLIKVFELAPVS